jgi:hypothetical protein
MAQLVASGTGRKWLFWSVAVLGGIFMLSTMRESPESAQGPQSDNAQGSRPIVSSNWRESNIKEFRAQLGMFHRGDVQASPEALEDCVENLIRSGTAADDAFRAVLIVIQSPSINPAFACQIAETARNIAAVKAGRITR